MKVYAVKHKDEAIRADSRSGGIFTAISDQFLDSGVVYGCIMESPYKAVHIRTISKEQRDLMHGSKYIQSELGDTFKSVKADLESGLHVLFSGVPCQVAGLRNYLGKEYDNLLCIDVLCHGVPSRKVWEAYVKWQEKENKSIVKRVNFRDKSEAGWRDHVESLTFMDNKKISSNIYTTIFYSHNSLRKSCYHCPYKSIVRQGDISIADYWGVENNAPEFDDNKGVSLVLVNTDEGMKCFENAKSAIDWKETNIETSMQNALRISYPEPETRDQFWKDFNSKDFSYIAKKYGGLISIRERAIRKVKRIVKGFRRWFQHRIHGLN